MIATWVLVLAIGSQQGVYAGNDNKAIRFPSFEACEKVAKSERERITPLVKGQFLLACVTADKIGDDE